ncbi:MAG TPA: hypothetical protein VM869_25425 [Enhygromyxa sp.]|nr:hypothetical protein [Enhygromyxa sp.]
MISTPEGWQLLLEHGDVYLRWELRGPPGHPGVAWPATDVAAASLESPSGSLFGKPALEREGNEVGLFKNIRERDGEIVAMGECLDDGVLELEFDGALMSGRWRITRSGQSRREAEAWTLRPIPDQPSEA